MMRLFGSPACLADPGNLAVVGELPETATADAELLVNPTWTAAQRAATAMPRRELRLTI